MAISTFEKIYEAFGNILADSKLEEEFRESFSLSSPVNRIKDCYIFLYDSGLLPLLVNPDKKSDKRAENFRTAGNKYYVAKNYAQALKSYSAAVANATSHGSELTLAYANRSAVTWALKEYQDGINDIDRALIGKYPKHLRYKLLERKGKCLMGLNLYSTAIKSFEDALLFLNESNLDKTKRLHFEVTIKGLIEICQKSSDEKGNNQTPQLPQLSHPNSNYIECASEAVDIEYTPAMGRYVVAAVDIYPGDVLAVEKPYVSELLPANYTTYCNMCKKRCHSMIPCSQCTQVMFCSENCKNDMWEESHRVACNIFPTLVSLGCDKMDLLAVKLLLKVTKQGKGLREYFASQASMERYTSPREKGFTNGKYISSEPTSVHNLIMNETVRKMDDVLRRVIRATCILHILKEYSPYFDFLFQTLGTSILDCNLFEAINEVDLLYAHLVVGATLLKNLFCIPCNGHEVSEMLVMANKKPSINIEVGDALYPFLSLINHSCDPNVVRHIYDGDVAVLTAIQIIKKGEQVFDNYGYHHALHDVETRQERLCLQYYFVCKCLPCLENWPLYNNLPETPVYYDGVNKKELEGATEEFQKILVSIQDGDTSHKLPFLYSYLTLVHNSVQRPWKVYNKCQEAIKQCLSVEANHYYHK